MRLANELRLRISVELAYFAIALGLYSRLVEIADLILIVAVVLQLTTRQGRSSSRSWILALIWIPVASSTLWSLDQADTARISLRLLGLLLTVPLLRSMPRTRFPIMLAGFVLAAGYSFTQERPQLFSANAFAAAELGLVATLTAHPVMTVIGIPLLAVTKTRSTLLLLWFYALLSRRRALAAVAAVTTILWFVSWGLSGSENRFAPDEVVAGAVMRADNSGLVDTGFSEQVGEEHGLVATPDNREPVIAESLGTGAGSYNEATALQRPHSAPVLIWQELRLAALPVFAGLILLLRRLHFARAATLSVLWIVFSDSVAGDAAGMYLAALLATHSDSRGSSALIPKPSGQFHFLRFGIFRRFAGS